MLAGGTQRPSHNLTPERQPRDPKGAIEGTRRRPHGCPLSNPQSAPLVTDGLLWPQPQARGHTVTDRSHGHTPLHKGHTLSYTPTFLPLHTDSHPPCVCTHPTPSRTHNTLYTPSRAPHLCKGPAITPPET